MRLVLAIILFCCGGARANPRVVGSAEYNLGPAYISYERLSIQLSAAEARFVGTFAFRFVPTDAATERTYIDAAINIPVWFPIHSESDPSITNFWALFKTQGWNSISAFPQRKAFEQGIGMTVILGNKPHHSTGGFQAALGVDEVFPSLSAEPGFCRIVCSAKLSREDIKDGLPVTLRYRQPLCPSPEGGRLFYVPMFVNLPRGVSTGNTNFYSITLTASKDSTVFFTCGAARELKLEPGCSITLSPSHMKPIRAVVTRANPQDGANGKQPFGSETNRALAAAASRRSP